MLEMIGGLYEVLGVMDSCPSMVTSHFIPLPAPFTVLHVTMKLSDDITHRLGGTVYSVPFLPYVTCEMELRKTPFARRAGPKLRPSISTTWFPSVSASFDPGPWNRARTGGP